MPAKQRQYPMRCYYCDQVTYAIEVARVMNRDRTLDGEYYVNEDGQRLIYTTILAKCSKCGAATILGRDNESADNKTIYGIWPKEGDLWSSAVDPTTSKLIGNVPSALMHEFAEAKNCLKARAHTATAVMVRRVLEGVLRDLGIIKQPLIAALRAARSSDVIDDRLSEWAQALRAIGNDGAHFTGRSVTKEDATDALELCEAILNHIYVVPAKAKGLQRRRSTQKQPP